MEADRYYYHADVSIVDNALVGGGADAVLTTLQQFILGSNVSTQTLYFGVSVLAGVATQTEYTLHIETQGGDKGIVIDNQFYSAASIGLLSAALPLIAGAVFPGVAVPVLAFSLTIGGISFLNTAFGDSLGGLLEFIIEGDFDAELQLTDVNGNVLAGALYDSGVPLNLPEAVGLLLGRLGEEDTPGEGVIPTAGMTVVVRSDSQASRDDGSVRSFLADRMITEMFDSDDSAFKAAGEDGRTNGDIFHVNNHMRIALCGDVV